MGGTNAHLSVSQLVFPPGYLHPPAALAAPDRFRASSGLKPQEYTQPALKGKGETWRVAVKVIDPRGNEGMWVLTV